MRLLVAVPHGMVRSRSELSMPYMVTLWPWGSGAAFVVLKAAEQRNAVDDALGYL